MTNRAAALLMIGLLATPHLFAQPDDDPWTVPRERFFSGVKTIAVPALSTPVFLEKETQMRQRVTALITRELEALGFEVVPVTECEAMWERLCNRLGGLEDPATDQITEERVAAARKHFLNELQVRYGADALLHSAIIGVQAFLGDGKRAEWCGTHQTIRQLPTSIRKRPRGYPAASCLAILIEDALGVDMYNKVYGIEVVVTPEGGEWVPIPPEALFADEEKLRKALHATLGPLGAP